jgi:hypothetical protein
MTRTGFGTGTGIGQKGMKEIRMKIKAKSGTKKRSKIERELIFTALENEVVVMWVVLGSDHTMNKVLPPPEYVAAERLVKEGVFERVGKVVIIGGNQHTWKISYRLVRKSDQ